MDNFQDELYRLVQDVKEGINPFSSKEEDAGSDVQLVAAFSKKWDYKSKHDATQKELQSLKSSTGRDRLEIAKKAVLSVLKDIIPALDDAYKIMSYLEDSPTLEKGMEAIISHLEQVFSARKGGVIDPKEGDKFEPDKHLAIGAATVGENYDGPPIEKIIVSEAVRKGYHALGRVIRSAEVKVLAPISE